MRISDWSSDVCSSDLLPGDPHPVAGRLRAVRDDPGGARAARDARRLWPRERIDPAARSDRAPDPAVVRDAHPAQPRARARPDRARAVGGGLDRKSVVLGKSVSVRVDHGGRRHIKKTRRQASYYQRFTTTHNNNIKYNRNQM